MTKEIQREWAKVFLRIAIVDERLEQGLERLAERVEDFTEAEAAWVAAFRERR